MRSSWSMLVTMWSADSAAVIGIVPVERSTLAHRLLGGEQLAAVVPGHGDIDDHARLDRCVEPHRGEMLGAAAALRLGQHAAPGAELRVEMRPQRCLAFCAKPPGALLDQLARQLWHARGRRA